jgi:uncharacterized surface protein with fasciclin (FAS1) repeats
MAAPAVFGAAARPLAAAEPAKKDIVETAAAAGNFKTLLQAVKAAGLEEALKNPGPLTVFAPTDQAFAAIEKDKLAALLADKQALTAVLTYHVIPERVLAKDAARTNSVVSMQGQPLAITSNGGKVKVNQAQVIQADILCANGVIHVIDAVLLPSKATKPAQTRVREAFQRAAEVPEATRQVVVFKQAAVETRQLAASNQFVKEVLDNALDKAAASEEPQQAAAALQEGLQEAERLLSFQPLLEAELPAGFPEPTPVGEIRLKSYPAYRLARTSMTGRERQGQAFFTLFKHITENGIAMTAPVEITYGALRDNAQKTQAMAFLYETPKLGTPGQQGKVTVVDLPAMTTVSLGLQGDATAERVAEAGLLLQSWLEQHQPGYEAAGPLRVMGYNSPMVPVERRYVEIEIPVRERTNH